jgi:hypothetical protein
MIKSFDKIDDPFEGQPILTKGPVVVRSLGEGKVTRLCGDENDSNRNLYNHTQLSTHATDKPRISNYGCKVSSVRTFGRAVKLLKDSEFWCESSDNKRQ